MLKQLLVLALLLPLMAACRPVIVPLDQVAEATPTPDPGIYNQVPDTTLTAIFGADNMISGSAGCNSYSGAYQLEGQSLTIPGRWPQRLWPAPRRSWHMRLYSWTT